MFGLRYRSGRATLVFSMVDPENFDQFQTDTDPEYRIEPPLV